MTANEENALKMDRAHVITDQPANYNPQADDIAMKNKKCLSFVVIRYYYLAT